MRLVIILLLLVVLPTGILSVLAGRSIQAREAILYRRLEQDAMQQIDGVREAFRGILQADADQVQTLFRDTVLAQGGSRHPMDIYRDFRGREPSTEALLRHNGLLATDA